MSEDKDQGRLPQAPSEQQATPAAGQQRTEGASSPPHYFVTEHSITASGAALYMTFGQARIVVGPEGNKGLLAKEWFGTMILSPTGFKQFVRNVQQILELYETEWGAINDLPGTQEPTRREG